MNNYPSAPPLEPESFQPPIYYYGYTAPPTYPPPVALVPNYQTAPPPATFYPVQPQPQQYVVQKRSESDSCIGLFASFLCCCCLLEEVDNCTKY